jgi:hypothetical protein
MVKKLFTDDFCIHCILAVVIERFVKIPWAVNSSFQPESKDFKSLTLSFNGGVVIGADIRGVRNHIDELKKLNSLNFKFGVVFEL